MKKIGIFLGFQPGMNLSTEGISRLLAFYLKQNINNSESIIIYCPAWLKGSLTSLLEDNKIAIEKFEIVTTKQIPIGVKIKSYIKERKNKKYKPSKLKQILSKTKKRIEEVTKNAVSDLFGTTSYFKLILKVLVYLVAFIVLIPIIILLIVLLGLYKLGNKLKAKLVRIMTNKGKKLSKLRSVIYQMVLDNELNKLVALINKNDEVKVCYIPSMIWPQISRINCKKVVAAPDIVFYDFPTQYRGVMDIHRRIRSSIEAADNLICYSEYVKDYHLVKKCGVNPAKITVIPHANVDMSEYLKISKSISDFITPAENAKQIVENYIKTNYGHGHVLRNSNINEFDLVIYSSQFRPHKNIFNLIKAIKVLNREMYCNIKLILTGNISKENYIQEYIREYNLENDIFVMHGLTSEVLAAFNKIATCSVNPTLFEGGFPFTFSEGYSVGTPSVMSNIPVISTEIEQKELRDVMLFDPYNPHSIARRIEWAVNNKEYLFSLQGELYQKYDKRDWTEVVGEYNQVFNKFTN